MDTQSNASCKLNVESQVPERVTTLLSAVGMQQYAAVFKDREYETIPHLRDLSHADLEEMGVPVDAHRKAILNGISSHFPCIGATEEKQSIENNDGACTGQ
eukprot:295745_1